MHVDEIFKLGETIVVTKTNPGYTGTIQAILSTGSLAKFFGEELISPMVQEWARLLGKTPTEVGQSPIYHVYFGRKVLSAAKKEGAEPFQSDFMLVSHLDAMREKDFWAQKEEQVDKE